MGAALFHHFRGENLPDTEDNWSAITDSAEQNMLCGDPPLELNDDHPDVEDAINALERLSNYMSEHEDTLAPLLKKEWRCTYDLADRTFWNEVTNH